MMPSRRATAARPVRMCLSSVFNASTEACMRRSVSFLISAIVGMSAPSDAGDGDARSAPALRLFHDAPDGLPHHHAPDVAGDEEIEDADGHAVLAAERDGGRVHHAEPALEDRLV